MTSGFHHEDDEDDDQDAAGSDDLTFDELCAVLRRWEGQLVGVTAQGPPEGSGNTTLHTRGLLSQPDQVAVTVIDSRGGRIEAFRVGDGHFQLVEGDFVEAETWDLEDELIVGATFREIGLNFVGPCVE